MDFKEKEKNPLGIQGKEHILCKGIKIILSSDFLTAVFYAERNGVRCF